MTLLDSLSSLFTGAAYAEEPPEESKEDDSPEDATEGKQDSGEGGEGEGEGESEEGGDGEDGGEEEGGDDEDEEEEEEEEEPEDPMPKLHEDCAKTAACSHAKDEYDGCAFRVQKWQEADEEERKELGPKEDCVEEFFEFTHCVSQCAAPKLFGQLK